MGLGNERAAQCLELLRSSLGLCTSTNVMAEELAGAIGSSQRTEIETMQGMIEEICAPPVEDAEPMLMDEGDNHH